MYEGLMSLYEVLGLSRGAGQDDIKKAYRKAALKEHPDKGGDVEKFKKIQEAYSVLSDPAKKSHYDQTGQLSQEGHGIDLSQMFGGMFGGMPGMSGMPGMPGMPNIFQAFQGFQGPQQARKVQRGPNKIHDIGISLSDLYHGKKIVLTFKRDTLCSECKGKGGSVQLCTDCNGRGICMVQQQIGPMIAMSQIPCGSCQQTGSIVTEACSACYGKKVTESETVLEAQIQPGLKDGDRIVFPEKCSESPQFETPGDVVLVIQEIQDPVLKRSGDDLTCDIQLSLSESLLGFERTLDGHPSGKPVVLTSDTVRHTDVITVNGYGMPKPTGGFGDLQVRCLVSLSKLSESQKDVIKSAFTELP
jgi:DnaJ family protein A protein 2